MGVEGVGVERFFYVVDGAAIGKSLTVVGVEDALRHAPVCLAMLQAIYVAMIFVCEVVETDVYRFAVERSYRHG